MIVGIDLGTTNSAVAVWRDGEATLIPNSIGDVLTPSAVGVSDEGAVLVGMAARERRATHPALTATAFKRQIGTQQKLQIGQHLFSPEDLSALVLRALKADAEEWLGEPVDSAVITVPAYFNDRQRKATRRAGEIAGLKVERLLNEPTAAALAHGIHEKEDKNPFLVFDLGGGTFDVSIVEIFEGIIEVRASAGDNRLGGEDFNDVLADLALGQFPALAGIAHDSRLREMMRAAAERCRRALTTGDPAAFSFVWEGQPFETAVTAADFEAAAGPLVARLRDPVLRSLRDSGVVSETLSEVVLVGGATRMPLVRRAVTRMFGRFPDASVHPDHAVALGAAVQAGLRARDAALNEIRLTDVCPFTLGVDTTEFDSNGRMHPDVFAPIIERNTVIPASRVHAFSTVHDNQKAVQFGIYQGEARNVASNVKLGTVSVPVPPRPAGRIHVDCRFSYDTSGLLEVDLTVPETGMTKQLVIHDDEDAPDEAELAARRAALAGLKVHPRDDAANAAVLARAARCYEFFLGERRDHIGQLILAFEAALERQDPRDIAHVRREVEERLNALEGERFL
ncbi:Hsp70 family protein [Chelatococcus reniformis]|uniref:Molecular chaperone HscC n=1 Tax=Chelatococcus reniformis TaxID=1494448 RepID=A0A916ULB6_9HYPH|nr:molecular chaperone HscC [Chelatococcus reniformis]GGC75846.1 molecular chaperone HscC [Chelatococcus reniformis]